MKEVFIRGNDERDSEVIKMLEDLGGKRDCNSTGKGYYYLYYLDKDNYINAIHKGETLGLVIQKYFEELHLPEKKELPNSWEEWVEQNERIDSEYYVNVGSSISNSKHGERSVKLDGNLLATQKDAEAILDLIKLKRSRDTYRQRWIPDWKTFDAKHCIERFKGNFKTTISYHMDYFLAFQSEELRDKFYTNFQYLIEIAKEFI